MKRFTVSMQKLAKKIWRADSLKLRRARSKAAVAINNPPTILPHSHYDPSPSLAEKEGQTLFFKKVSCKTGSDAVFEEIYWCGAELLKRFTATV